MSSGLEGRTLGQYRLVERLGRGGMAEVYKAYQPSLDRYVAIKVLHAYFAEEEDFRQRFQREARAVARLRHPNIVQVHDFGVEGDVYYMAMEFLAGGTLKQRLRESEGLLSHAEVLRIVERVAAALDYAHARGIYHRDVKPANIMLTEDHQVILTDFGLAKMAEGSQYTRSGLSVGTPEYMAPEQGQGLPVDHRADVYSLGVVLYELLTGQLPYTADTPVAVIFKHIRDPLPLPRSVNPGLDEGFERVILKALAKSPGDRYQGAGELAAALRQAMVGVGEDLPTPPPAPTPDTGVLSRETPPPSGPPAPPPSIGEPGQRIEQTVKRAVSHVAGADVTDDRETIGRKMEERTKRMAAHFADAEGEEDWEAIGQKISERVEEKAVEERAKAEVKPAGAGGSKRWFLAGCLTSLALLACFVCTMFALGVCGDREGAQRPSAVGPPQPTPAEPAEPDWIAYDGLGLTMRHPSDWRVEPLEGPLGEGVQFWGPRGEGEADTFYAVYVRPQGPLPLDRLLESFQERALENVTIRESGGIEPVTIGGEKGIWRSFDGHYGNEQAFWGILAGVSHGDRLYLILAMAPRQHQDVAQEVFEAMTGSIRFTP